MGRSKLIELLETEAEELDAAFKKASIEGRGTPQEVSDRREELVKKFLGKYFPFPFQITKGNIIDSYGENSASIDCIILDPCHPHTVDIKTGRSSVLLADGVDFAIEVKGKLAGKEIVRALEQIYTVKKLRRVQTGIVIKEYETEQARRIPSIIFAFDDGDNCYNLLQKISEFYIKRGIKRIYQFDMIVLHDKIILNNNEFFFDNLKEPYLLVYDSGTKTLALMLFLMAYFPLAQPQMDENIMKIYLKELTNDKIPVTYFADINQRLLENEQQTNEYK